MWWNILASIFFLAAIAYGIRLFLRWRHRRAMERLQAEYEARDWIIELPESCNHSPWPTEECSECHNERDLIESGIGLDDPDAHHPLPLPAAHAIEVLAQLHLDKWVPPWSLRWSGGLDELETILQQLWIYGMIQTRDDEQPIAGNETEIMLTDRGWTSRGEDRTMSHVVAVTEKR